MTNPFEWDAKLARSLATIDVESLNFLRHLAGDEFPSVIRRYLSDGERYIQQMDMAFKNTSTTDLHQLAHTFKGSSGTLSANQLYELCDDLERTALGNPSHSQLAQLLNAIDSEFNNVKNALLHYLELHSVQKPITPVPP